MCCLRYECMSASSLLTWENLTARQAGFEPATRCLEGSRSIRLSYWRSVTIVHGVDHASATLRSQSARGTDPNQYTERKLLTLPDHVSSFFMALPANRRLAAAHSP